MYNEYHCGTHRLRSLQWLFWQRVMLLVYQRHNNLKYIYWVYIISVYWTHDDLYHILGFDFGVYKSIRLLRRISSFDDAEREREKKQKSVHTARIITSINTTTSTISKMWHLFIYNLRTQLSSCFHTVYMVFIN